MSDELATGLAASANEPVADTTATPDSILDAAFAEPSEPAAGSEPSGDPDPAKEPVAATQQPQTTEPPSGAKGEPPRERWETILANARTKAREEALAEHKQHLEVVAELKRDFPGTLARLLEEAAVNPQYSETITAKAAALLSARKQSAKADQEPQPDAVTRFDDGTQEPSYSPAQQRKWLEWRERQMKSGLLNEFKPLLEMKQQLEAHKQRQKDEETALQTVQTRWSEWESMPFLKENMEPIKARQIEIYNAMEARAKESGQPFDLANAPFQALSAAYREIVGSQVLPKLQSQQTDSLVATAARKRAASSSDPAAAAPAQPRKARTVDEALDQAFEGVGI